MAIYTTQKKDSSKQEGYKLKGERKMKRILKILKKNKKEGFLVGGAVRDLLLGRVANDLDFATNARPEETLEIFKEFQTIPLGIEFGTVVVVMDNEEFEITTYRADGEYSDSRKPNEVFFAETIEEDLSRRDFTINAMAMAADGEIVDPFLGQEDLRNGIIKAVGSADKRFAEDALRMLRAVRFAAQLDFKIEGSTFNAIIKNKDSIKNISKDRIQAELNKILVSSNPSKGLSLLQETGLLEILLLELALCFGFEQHNPHHELDIFNHTLAVVENVANSLELRLAALLHDIGKPVTFTLDDKKVGHFFKHESEGAEIAERIMKSLNYPRKTVEKIVFLIQNHMKADMSLKGLKKLTGEVGEELVFSLLDLQIADRLASTDKNIASLLAKKAELKTALEQGLALSRKDLAINGGDLLRLGKSGKEIGLILSHLLEIVLEDPTLNTKAELSALVETFTPPLG